MLHEEGWETLKHLIETRRELKRCECRLEDIVEKFLNVEVVRWLAYAEKKKKREKILEKKDGTEWYRWFVRMNVQIKILCKISPSYGRGDWN